MGLGLVWLVFQFCMSFLRIDFQLSRTSMSHSISAVPALPACPPQNVRRICDGDTGEVAKGRKRGRRSSMAALDIDISADIDAEFNIAIEGPSLPNPGSQDVRANETNKDDDELHDYFEVGDDPEWPKFGDNSDVDVEVHDNDTTGSAGYASEGGFEGQGHGGSECSKADSELNSEGTPASPPLSCKSASLSDIANSEDGSSTDEDTMDSESSEDGSSNDGSGDGDGVPHQASAAPGSKEKAAAIQKLIPFVRIAFQRRNLLLTKTNGLLSEKVWPR